MTFKPGFDPNRYNPRDQGITLFHKQMGELIRAHCLDAVDYVVSTMNNDKCSDKLRMVAATEVLNRGLGRPIDTQVMVSIGNDNTKDVSTMSDDELATLARSLARPIDQDNEVIDGEYTES